jgi:hypothetical protein
MAALSTFVLNVVTEPRAVTPPAIVRKIARARFALAVTVALKYFPVVRVNDAARRTPATSALLADRRTVPATVKDASSAFDSDAPRATAPATATAALRMRAEARRIVPLTFTVPVIVCATRRTNDAETRDCAMMLLPVARTIEPVATIEAEIVFTRPTARPTAPLAVNAPEIVRVIARAIAADASIDPTIALLVARTIEADAVTDAAIAFGHRRSSAAEAVTLAASVRLVRRVIVAAIATPLASVLSTTRVRPTAADTSKAPASVLEMERAVSPAAVTVPVSVLVMALDTAPSALNEAASALNLVRAVVALTSNVAASARAVARATRGDAVMLAEIDLSTVRVLETAADAVMPAASALTTPRTTAP